jgi:EF hand
MERREFVMLTTAFMGSALALGSPAPNCALAAESPIKALDTDKDRTLDLAEVKSAASKVFDRLDKDHDGDLSQKELRGRIGANDFADADLDKDGTLTKKEYLDFVEKLFKEADSNNDGTLDAKELRSKAGKALLRLIR